MTALARSIFKNILLILNILIFNNILSQTVPQNIDKKSDIRDSVSLRKDTVTAKKDTIIPKEELEDVVKTKAEYRSSSSISNKQTSLNKNAQIILLSLKSKTLLLQSSKYSLRSRTFTHTVQKNKNVASRF